eukprot:jgi/Botrbrau1/2458/Bobra.0226s0017.1
MLGMIRGVRSEEEYKQLVKDNDHMQDVVAGSTSGTHVLRRTPSFDEYDGKSYLARSELTSDNAAKLVAAALHNLNEPGERNVTWVCSQLGQAVNDAKAAVKQALDAANVLKQRIATGAKTNESLLASLISQEAKSKELLAEITRTIQRKGLAVAAADDESAEST